MEENTDYIYEANFATDDDAVHDKIMNILDKIDPFIEEILQESPYLVISAKRLEEDTIDISKPKKKGWRR